MDPLAYHVLHQGRRMGPYDRRTIVGLRIKKTLSSEHQLEASDGSRLTVGELIGRKPPAADFNALRSGGYSSAKATFSASLVESEPGPVEVPAFRGEIELRVHSDVLRLAGKHRNGLGLKDVRVKLPLKDIAFVRTNGSRLDLWLRAGQAVGEPASLQHMALELFSDGAAGELVQWLPGARPWPEPADAIPAMPGHAALAHAPVNPMLWASVIGIAMVVAIGLFVLARRGF